MLAQSTKTIGSCFHLLLAHEKPGKHLRTVPGGNDYHPSPTRPGHSDGPDVDLQGCCSFILLVREQK